LCLNVAGVGKSSKLNRKQVFLQHGTSDALDTSINKHNLFNQYNSRAIAKRRNTWGTVYTFIEKVRAHELKLFLSCIAWTFCRAMMWCRHRQFSVFGVRFGAEAETHALGEGREGSFQTEALGPELRVPDDVL